MKVRLTTIDIATIGTIALLVASAPFQGNVLSRPSVFLKFVDCIDFNLGFRGRVPPRIQNSDKNSQIGAYELGTDKLSRLQMLYVYLSAVGIKYGCGLFLNFCFFGVLKPPVMFDVLLFNLALLLVQFSYEDIVYRRFSSNPAYAVVHSVGVSVFKTKKLASLVQKGLKFNLDRGVIFVYCVLAMEFTGTFRSVEPILYHMEDRAALEVVEAGVFKVIASFDTFADMLGVALLLIGNSIGGLSAFAWLFVFPLFLFRWERKTCSKQFGVDLDLLLSKMATFPAIDVEIEPIYFTDINVNALVASFQRSLKSLIEFLKEIYLKVRNLHTFTRPKLKLPFGVSRLTMPRIVFTVVHIIAFVASTLNQQWIASVVIVSFGLYDTFVMSRVGNPIEGCFEERLASYSEILAVLMMAGVFSLGNGNEISFNSIHLIVFHIVELCMLSYLTIPHPLDATVERSSGLERLQEHTNHVFASYYAKFYVSSIEGTDAIKVKSD